MVWRAPVMLRPSWVRSQCQVSFREAGDRHGYGHTHANSFVLDDDLHKSDEAIQCVLLGVRQMLMPSSRIGVRLMRRGDAGCISKVALVLLSQDERNLQNQTRAIIM